MFLKQLLIVIFLVQILPNFSEEIENEKLVVTNSPLAASVEYTPPKLPKKNKEIINYITNELSSFLGIGNSSKLNTTKVEPSDTNVTQKFVNCLPGLGTREVQLVNDTELIKLLATNPNVTSRETPSNCILVLFYSKTCPFSALAAPHYNALPRAFPDIKLVAINAMIYHLFNTQNGIVGVPSLLLFHGGKAVAKFNDSEYTLEIFSKFLTRATGIAAVEKSFVSSADFGGPVYSQPTNETDQYMILSYVFLCACAIYMCTKSNWWTSTIEAMQRNWRESAQHEHEHLD